MDHACPACHEPVISYGIGAHWLSVKAYSIIEANVPLVHELIMEVFISLLLPWQHEKNTALGQSLLFSPSGCAGTASKIHFTLSGDPSLQTIP